MTTGSDRDGQAGVGLSLLEELYQHRALGRARLDRLLAAREPVTVAELAALVHADRDLGDRIEDLLRHGSGVRPAHTPDPDGEQPRGQGEHTNGDAGAGRPGGR